tara:strand:- start:5497 stop:5862 length:366 start_codon:yes stop_codon:yes gene_type:complete
MNLTRVLLTFLLLCILANCGETGVAEQEVDCFRIDRSTNPTVSAGSCSGVGFVRNSDADTYGWEIIGPDAIELSISDIDYIFEGKLAKFLNRKVSFSGRYRYDPADDFVQIVDLENIEYAE